MTLPVDLQRLPPQALDVIRYLGTQEDGGADLFDMMDDLGMTERGARKWLRRLVTRYYVEMPFEGYYSLTANGQQAAQSLREYDGTTPQEAAAQAEAETAPAPAVASAPSPAAPAAAPDPAPAATAAPAVASDPDARYPRAVAALVPKELVIRSKVVLKAGFDRVPDDQMPPPGPVRAILRVSAPGCDVAPVERPLDVPPEGPAGPVQFKLTPRSEGLVRVKVEVFQLVTLQELVPVGGMYFDLNVAGFPTPQSSEMQALGTTVGLHWKA